MFQFSNEIRGNYTGVVISISLLFVLPACVSALIVFLTDMSGKKERKYYTQMPLWIMGLVLLASAITLREGVICVLMLSPFWWLAALFGSQTVYRLQQKYKIGGGINSMILAIVPFLSLFIETQFQQPTDHYAVTRSIIIEAPVQDIWPLLVKLDDIQSDEGKWNLTQNLLGVPKPAKATIDMANFPYIRHAEWGKNITFEEHITEFKVNQKMGWDFVFPNESVSAHTDRHISADGHHLKIRSGSYDLISVSSTQTELVLNTTYRATSPVNLYAKLWGELILGDIQTNILHLIQDRAEGDIAQPNAAMTSTAQRG